MPKYAPAIVPCSRPWFANRVSERASDLRVLILGGYGFIGKEIAVRLKAAGHELAIAGRNATVAKRVLPGVDWIPADFTDDQRDDVWRDRLQGIDVVVNAAGALQDSAQDDLEAVHHRSIATIVRACESSGVSKFVQISSVGAQIDANTEFLRSKGRGDACVSSSKLSWFILRPGLVIGPNAYGGTALIRMLASFPLIQPIALGDSPIQTVSADELCSVVLDAIEGRVPGCGTFDVVEEKPHTLRQVVRAFRAWLGFREAPMEVRVPDWVLIVTSKCADALGRLGWRSPLRTTAIRVLADGVRGDPGALNRISSRRLSDLRQTLDAIPSTLQDRWFGRLYLGMPFAVAVLSVFWILTGVIALLKFEESIQMSGLTQGPGAFFVASGSLVDIALGGVILYRPWSRAACCGMAAITFVYVVAGSLLRPDLWLDPLGPLLKALPVLVLTLMTALLLEDR